MVGNDLLAGRAELVNVQPIVVKRVALGAAALGSFLPWVDIGEGNLAGRGFTQGSIVMIATLVGLLVSFSPPADPRARTFETVIGVGSLAAALYF
ncbi:MAG: hypothetical protein ACT4QF_15735 [Sporichthyaceae bacterium]